MSTPQDAFEQIVKKDTRLPNVDIGRMFGSDGLRVGGKVYAMLVKGQLVVKLRAARVEKLVMSGAAEPFDPGHGRVMKEWAAVPPAKVSEWRKLVTEARRFVESTS
jgi:TfoX/Sxy family transcriptional regulator of competence genes